MPVVQPVLEQLQTLIERERERERDNMIIVGKSMPIDNYEKYKTVINQITD